MSDFCNEKHEKVTEDISGIKQELASTKESLKVAWKVINKNEESIEETKEFQGMFMKLETQVIGIDSKVDTQIRQSEKNTEAIIRALAEVNKSSKKTIEDRILDALVPAIIMGGMIAFIYFTVLKGVI